MRALLLWCKLMRQLKMTEIVPYGGVCVNAMNVQRLLNTVCL